MSNRYSTSLKPILDGEFEWIQRYILYVSTEVLSTGSSIFEIAPEQVGTLRGGVARVHVAMAEGRDERET